MKAVFFWKNIFFTFLCQDGKNFLFFFFLTVSLRGEPWGLDELLDTIPNEANWHLVLGSSMWVLGRRSSADFFNKFSVTASNWIWSKKIMVSVCLPVCQGVRIKAKVSRPNPQPVCTKIRPRPKNVWLSRCKNKKNLT